MRERALRPSHRAPVNKNHETTRKIHALVLLYLAGAAPDFYSEISMKIINACNASLSPGMIRAATTGYALANCRLHPAQLAAFEMLAFSITQIIEEQLENGEPLPDLRATSPRTIAGIPIEPDLEFPMTMIQFLDADGVAVTQIECLAIPMAFA